MSDTPVRFKCRKCLREIQGVEIGAGSDIFGMLAARDRIMHCTNPDCEWFGVVVTAGIPIVEAPSEEEPR